MQDRKTTTRHGVKEKRSTKTLKHPGKLFRKNLQLIVNNSRFKSHLDHRSKESGKHSIGGEFQSLAVRGKKLLT